MKNYIVYNSDIKEDKKIYSKGQIGKVTLTYIDEEVNKHFSKVLVIPGEELIKFEVTKYSKSEIASHSYSDASRHLLDVDMDIKIDIGKMEYYYFHSLTMKMLNHLSKLSPKEQVITIDSLSPPSLTPKFNSINIII